MNNFEKKVRARLGHFGNFWVAADFIDTVDFLAGAPRRPGARLVPDRLWGVHRAQIILALERFHPSVGMNSAKCS